MTRNPEFGTLDLGFMLCILYAFVTAIVIDWIGALLQ